MMRAAGFLMMMLLTSIPVFAAVRPQPRFVPLTKLMQAADVTVHGVIESVQVETSRSLGVTSEGRLIRRFNIRLRVLSSVPPIDRDTITFSNIGDPKLRFFNVGRELIACVKRDGDSYRRIDITGIWGMFVAEESGDKTVIRMAPHFHPHTPERAWEHVEAVYRRMNGARDPDRMRARLETLKRGSLTEAYLALEELTAPPQPAVTSADLVDALEIQYRRVRGGMTSGAFELNDLVRSIAKILVNTADDRAVSRTLALYTEDRSDPRGPILGYFNWDYNILRFALKHPGPSRAASVRSLLGHEVDIYDRKKKIGSTVIVPVDGTALHLVAQTPGGDIDPLLNGYLAAYPEFMDEMTSSRLSALKHPVKGDSDLD